MKKYRQRALGILLANITTGEAPSHLLQWVETGNQNLLLSYEEEGQLLVEIAEALEEAAGEKHALLEAEIKRLRDTIQRISESCVQDCTICCTCP